jgi:hypothetical protein
LLHIESVRDNVGANGLVPQTLAERRRPIVPNMTWVRSMRSTNLSRSSKIYPVTATRLGGFYRRKRHSLSQRALQPQSALIAARYIDSGRAAKDDDCGEAGT